MRASSRSLRSCVCSPVTSSWICSAYRSRPQNGVAVSPRRSALWIATLAGTGILAICGCGGNQHQNSGPPPSTNSSWQPTVGKQARIARLPSLFGAYSKQDFDQAVKDANANDSYALHQLLLSGRFVLLNKGAPVLVIDEAFPGTYRVRLLKDPATAVWVDGSWIRSP